MNISKKIIEAAKRIKEYKNSTKPENEQTNRRRIRHGTDEVLLLEWAVEEALAWENQIQGGP